MASVHMVVDGYGNIYAPLLPLLAPKLGLSLAMAGTLTMLYQMAASVAQVGFGHIADRWKPRLLVMTGPIVAVGVLSFIGVAPSVTLPAAVLIAGGLGAAAFHPPAAALAHRPGDRPGLAMSVHHRRHARLLAGPLFRAVRGASVCAGRRLAIPGLIVVAFF